VTIHHADGETTVRINQQEVPEHGKLFRTLGTFRFKAGRDGWVRVSNDGTEENKVAIADAVQWLPVAEKADAGAALDLNDLRKRAEAGDADAQYRLGGLYGKGSADVPKDDAEAVKWYRKAAEQGDRRGQSMLGVMYTNARGVSRDYDEAMKWFRLAAAQNSAHAQYNLGYMYAVGKGVERDDEQSAEWYQLAAEQGDKTSQRILGSLYAAGRGVPKALDVAHAWTVVAGGEANPTTKAQLAKLTAQMTPKELTSAADLAAIIGNRVAAKVKRLQEQERP
jgi:TPR repeat protein